VYEAYKAVKSNKGAAGVDGQTIEQFEADLGGNLYKIWNRMSSGSYFPPPVRAVTIPKKSGGERILVDRFSETNQLWGILLGVPHVVVSPETELDGGSRWQQRDG
jgi:hypothetical protein